MTNSRDKGIQSLKNPIEWQVNMTISLSIWDEPHTTDNSQNYWIHSLVQSLIQCVMPCIQRSIKLQFDCSI
jgi:hypothetical protein